jgi:ribosomal protein L37E
MNASLNYAGHTSIEVEQGQRPKRKDAPLSIPLLEGGTDLGYNCKLWGHKSSHKRDRNCLLPGFRKGRRIHSFNDIIQFTENEISDI